MKQLLLLLLGAHLAIVALRIPSKHWGNRLDEIQRYQEQGRYHFYFRQEQRQNGDLLQWLAENTPQDSVLLWRGEWKGALEFAPALLWPRLLVDARALPPGQDSFHGRKVAAGRYPGLGSGQFVIVAEADLLHLELR
ncbi:MAG: hypothetical protein CSA62_05535 [Planctomycetota bacterium]|nr:MAG: hypothetical protein CSA62_05535 [Planctomycetota bacterium]